VQQFVGEGHLRWDSLGEYLALAASLGDLGAKTGHARAALLANEVAQAYIDESLSQKLKVTENASKWLDERRDSLSESARASELALYAFRKQSDMLSTSIDDRANMV
jgi:monomeric isocitrate dehydrogenase